MTRRHIANQAFRYLSLILIITLCVLLATDTFRDLAQNVRALMSILLLSACLGVLLTANDQE